LETITGPQTGSTTSFTWDGYGRIATITDVNGHTTSYNYDSLNRVTTITYPDSTFEQNVYTNISLTQTKDRQNRWTRYFYNPDEQLIGILDSANRATSYDICTCGEMKGITDPLGHRTSWAQDLEGRITSKTFFDNSSITYAYENTTSRLKTITDAAGQITTNTYNHDDSVSQTAYTNATVSTPTVSYVYDSVYPRITSMTDGTGTTSYTYNAVTSGTLGSGRLGSETGPLGSTATISYTYDALGRVTATGINGTSSSVGFDSLGRVNTATNPLGTFTYSYVGVTPRLQSVSSTNGPTANYSYLTTTQDVRLGEIQNLNNAGTTAISKFDYTYNPVGTIATWQQQQDSGTPTVWNYTYDGADQLLSATKTNTSTSAVISNYVYQYDLAGNRISEQIGMSVKSTSYNSLNQITGTSTSGNMQFTGTLSKPATVTVNGNSASVDVNNNFSGSAAVTPGTNSVQIIAKDYSNNYTTNNYLVVQPTNATNSVSYDSLGNMTNNGLGQTYQWDAKNELVGITYSGSAIVSGITQTTFTYDGRGRRVSIVESSSGTVVSTKQHLWIGNSIAEERDASNTVQKRFYAQGVQIAGSAYFYTRDHLGSVRELVDGSGTIQARYDYDPYGRVTLIQGTNLADFQYAGYYEHQPSGLNLTNYRAYDPNTGKWINRDPLAELGGVNLYGYCANDPINQIDVFGLTPPFSYYFNPGDSLYLSPTFSNSNSTLTPVPTYVPDTIPPASFPTSSGLPQFAPEGSNIQNLFNSIANANDLGGSESSSDWSNNPSDIEGNPANPVNKGNSYPDSPTQSVDTPFNPSDTASQGPIPFPYTGMFGSAGGLSYGLFYDPASQCVGPAATWKF
jgi:RHS repeat-associated protein